MRKSLFRNLLFVGATFVMSIGASLNAQEKSVAPEINKAFRKPDIADFQGKFEKEGREAFEHREAIVKACNIREGMQVADVGAGTGLFSRLFAPKVGVKGTVLGVDISEDFLKHIQESAREQNLANIQTVLCKQDSVELPDASVDLVFACDTYHHFEFPFKTLTSIHRALKPKFLLLGSSSLNLLDQAAESLTGRNRKLVLPPLRFSEALGTQVWTNADASPAHLCRHFAPQLRSYLMQRLSDLSVKVGRVFSVVRSRRIHRTSRWDSKKGTLGLRAFGCLAFA